MGVIRAVVAADGVAGLWKGAMPGLVSGKGGGARSHGSTHVDGVRPVVTDACLDSLLSALPCRPQIRSSILTASQCATYDEVKRRVVQYSGLKDGLHVHLSSSMIAGLVTTTITNPIDVIKTRMFTGEQLRAERAAGGQAATLTTSLKCRRCANMSHLAVLM